MKIISESWNTHIDSHTKQQAAYNKLKTAIISLDLPPNSVLIERYIMEMFDLSRTPMREAINRLHIEGFLSNIAGKGFFVNDIQHKDFLELYEIKEALESEAAYLCCARKNSTNIAKIEKAFQKYESSLSQNKYIKSMILDLDFHWAIVESANNQRLERQMSLIMDQTLKFFNIYYSDEIPPRISKSFCEQHKKILNTIKNDNPDAARQALLDHIQSVKEITRNDLFK